MRGGSSRGGFFLAKDLPVDGLERTAWLLAAYGSPDSRQIDGIGGADALTSKAAIVSKSSHPRADVDYTFCQVGIERPQVSTGGNCGNMLSAVGPFAIYKRLVQPTARETLVRIYTTNTKQIVTAHIPMDGDLPAVEGDCKIAGVPGAFARIMLDFGDCSGSVTGKLLPTGSPRNVITVDGRTIEVSLVDAATPFVYVRAADLGASGTELPANLLADPRLMSRLEEVRGWAAQAIGLVDNARDAADKSPNIPRVVMVAPPVGYQAIDGQYITAEDCDLVVRQLAMQRPHKALAVTGSVCTAVAAAVEDSVVAECRRSGSGQVRLGHPSGVLQVSSVIQRDGEQHYRIREAKIERTARLIMSGDLFLSRNRITEIRKILTAQSVA